MPGFPRLPSLTKRDPGKTDGKAVISHPTRFMYGVGRKRSD